MAEKLLLPLNTYLKSGIHIGTKFKTKHMAKFIYKTRPDKLSVLNLNRIDARIIIAAKILSHYNPEDILIVGRRENSWRPIKLFGKLTGTKIITGRYPPGMMTNPNLDIFSEPRILLVVDALPDKNAVKDANKLGIPVIALSDTNNDPNMVDLVVPCNNKGKKSLGTIFYLLAAEYLKLQGKISSYDEIDYTVDDFAEK